MSNTLKYLTTIENEKEFIELSEKVTIISSEIAKTYQKIDILEGETDFKRDMLKRELEGVIEEVREELRETNEKIVKIQAAILGGWLIIGAAIGILVYAIFF